MWNGFDGLGWGWIALGMLHMVLFWTLVILGIAAIAKWLGGRTARSGGPAPLDLLKARYANGELTRDEFERMRRELAA